jgi:hypothetical protein
MVDEMADEEMAEEASAYLRVTPARRETLEAGGIAFKDGRQTHSPTNCCLSVRNEMTGIGGL